MLLKVFIVEDNSAAREALAELLTATGGVAIVGQTDSENSATEWLRQHPGQWDLLVLDLLLVPGGSGFGVIQRARHQSRAGKVVVFSDFVTDVVADNCRKLGAHAVFRKADLPQLLAFVKALKPGVAG